MDLTKISARAKFRVGDYVNIHGHDRWLVVGRFYRRSTQQIIYELEWPGNKGRVKVEEGELKAA